MFSCPACKNTSLKCTKQGGGGGEGLDVKNPLNWRKSLVIVKNAKLLNDNCWYIAWLLIVQGDEGKAGGGEQGFTAETGQRGNRTQENAPGTVDTS